MLAVSAAKACVLILATQKLSTRLYSVIETIEITPGIDRRTINLPKGSVPKRAVVWCNGVG